MPASNGTPLLNTAAPSSDTVVTVLPQSNVTPSNRSPLRDWFESFFGLASVALGGIALAKALDASASKGTVIAWSIGSGVSALLSNGLPLII